MLLISTYASVDIDRERHQDGREFESNRTLTSTHDMQRSLTTRITLLSRERRRQQHAA